MEALTIPPLLLPSLPLPLSPPFFHHPPRLLKLPLLSVASLPVLASHRSTAHRSFIRCTTVATNSSSQDNSYEFRDDGEDLELRVQLPAHEAQISAANISVNAEDTSLSILLHTPAGYKVLLTVSRLYGHIKPAETVWFVDEQEIVLSLKKIDPEIAWPGLLEDWKALTVGVRKLLKGTSVYVVGESTEVNWAVAKELALGLRYAPLQTSRLLEQLTNKSLNDLLAFEGKDSVADAEALVLSNLNTQGRIVVSTLGGTCGAASRHDKWKNLHAGFTLWISLSGATDEASAEMEATKAKHEGHQAYANSDAVVALSGWGNSSRPAAEGCLKALKYLLESQKDLAGKKNLYVRLGCRGDWPNIMAPGWDPSGGETRTARTLAL